MLPPERTVTTGPSSGGPSPAARSSRYAVAAAPAGSTTSLARSSRKSAARDRLASLTVTTSSTRSRTIGKVTSPGNPTAMPSAIVAIRAALTG